MPAKIGQYNVQTEVFKAMANAGISVDFFNITPSEIVYTVAGNKTETAQRILMDMGYDPMVTRNCAKVSAVGAGIMGVLVSRQKLFQLFRKKKFRSFSRLTAIRRYGCLSMKRIWDLL